MARLLSAVTLLATISMAFALVHWPEGRDNTCADSTDCSVTSICAPSEPDPRSGLCGLACCYPSGKSCLYIPLEHR